jgi:DNA invertase Pin-like site-specific DNA recombinase
MAERKVCRCAVYTRKSTEYGLEQDFNSLDAQREACEAYIKSQAHEGWRLLPGHYDDGGVSGATLERPALQALLADVRARKVDVIVVYKVDRLTRSLADFAKLVELFDAYGVSFVSITQQLNTTTSMGRLTLNVLLSFAQFEREVTAERIRDKIAASKQKGMWVGGCAPLGYVVKDKKLVSEEHEAEQVRTIFRRYIELGSINALIQDLNDKGIVTKVRQLKSGKTVGGIPFFVGSLAHLLKNRLYVGEVAFAGKTYAGQHSPIIARDLFEAVQAKIRGNAIAHKRSRMASGSILIGRIYDDAGNRMTPTNSQKGPARYRYYLSAPWNHGARTKPGSISRVAASLVEEAVVAACRERRSKFHEETSDSEITETNLEQDCRQLIDTYVNRVIVSKQSVAMEFKVSGKPDEGGDGRNDHAPETIVVPLYVKNRKPRREIIRSGDSRDPTGLRSDSRRTLLIGIAKARAWTQELIEGRIAGTKAIARREGCSARYVRITLPLAFLAPDIIAAVVANAVPPNLGFSRFTENLPFSWKQQRQTFGL